MADRTFDPDSLATGTPTVGQPPAPSGALPSDAYKVEVLRTIADGTSTLNSSTQISRYPNELASASFPLDGPPVLTLAMREAAMLGLYRLLAGLRWHSFDFETLARTGAPQTRVTAHTLNRVFLDWPDERKGSMPAGAALITSPDRATFDSAGFQARLLEETADLFLPNTMLRYLGEQTVPLMLIFWCAHKDQRRGLEAKVSQLLAAERHTDAMGRRVIVPEYFSRTIRYTLVDAERPDGEESARGNEWILSFSITAEVQHVELVWSPGYVTGTEFGIDADPGSTPADCV